MRKKSALRAADSAVAARLRQAGAVIMGKTHLHQLAYGITGENSEYGDCVQPRDPQLFTGGSSSGSAASVQEGSAVAAIGTDTGGSIRVPAALCGLAGYRSTLGPRRRANVGGRLAPGGFVRHPGMALSRSARWACACGCVAWTCNQWQRRKDVTIAAVGESFLHDCEPAVLEVYHGWQEKLRSGMARRSRPSSPISGRTREKFSAASRAMRQSALHRGKFRAL